MHRTCSRYSDTKHTQRGSKMTKSPIAIAASLLVTMLLASASNAQQVQKEAVSIDLLITGATIVTMDNERRIIDNGEIAVVGDSIYMVGTAPLFPKGAIVKQKLDARGKLIVPGFVNGHTHVPMTLFRGLHD